MARRYFSNVAAPGYITASLSNVATTFQTANTAGGAPASPTGYPATYPFSVVLGAGTPNEEVMSVTAISGSNWTVIRGGSMGYGSTASSHVSGEALDLYYTAQDADESNAHIQLASGVHGLSGAVVGVSDTQTLTNKTLTTPTITGPILTGGSHSGTLTSTGTVNATVLQQSGSVVATVTGAETLTNKTLTTPTVASLANANHTHTDAAGGGSLSAYAKTDGSQNVLQGTTTTAFQVRGNAAPAADMFAVTNSAGAVKYLAVTSTGAVTVAGVLTTGDTLTGTALSPTHVPIIGKGAASQSANLLELRDSASVMQFAVDSGGSVSGIAGSSFGSWTAYTPTLTAVTTNPTLGSTGKIEDGYWTQVGKTVFFNLRLQFGTSGVSTGSGSYTVTLPVAPLRSYLRIEGYFIDASPTTRYIVHGLTSAGSTAMNIYTQTATPGVMGNVSPTNPVTVAVSDSIHFSGSYEVA